MIRRVAWLCMLVCLAIAASGAAPAPPTQPLRVAVYDVPPYGSVGPDGSISGLSVDLWRRVAERLEREFEFTPVADMDTLLRGLEQGRYDAAIGAITITADREARVDFSYPAHRSGVAVALRKETGPFSAFKAYVAAASELGSLILLALVLLVLTGLAMWISERPSHAAGHHGEAAVGTLRDGLYWAVVTMTTVGYGDKTPKTTTGRLIATIWMFGSLILVSLLSTSLVSRLTADRVERTDTASTIDLGAQKLAAVALSSGAEYLDTQHLAYAKYKDLPAALDALAKGRSTAVVNSIGALRYVVAKRFARDVEVAQGLLAPAYMAIALPHGSALKGPIDRALIQITGGPEWSAIEDRALGN